MGKPQGGGGNGSILCHRKESAGSGDAIAAQSYRERYKGT